MSVILISGGSGYIGSLLSKDLLGLGHEVRILSTQVLNKSKRQFAFHYDIKNSVIDEKAIEGVDIFIHLAGANIGAKRWSKAYRQEIIQSRVGSARLVFEAFKKANSAPSLVISASGTAFYADPCKTIITEDSKAGTGFLAEVCQLWEEAAFKFEKLGSKVVVLRTAPVITPSAGLLEAYVKTAFLRIIPTTGSPNNWISWIHPHDYSAIIQWLIQNPQNALSIYNATAPVPITQKDFVHAIDFALKKQSWHPNIPGFALFLAMGKKAKLALSNQQVLPQKLLEEGFHFSFENMHTALADLIPKK